MSDGKVMGRRQFFSRFFPVITETIVEKTTDEIKISTHSSDTKQTIMLDQAEAVVEVEENGGRKYPWVGM